MEDDDLNLSTPRRESLYADVEADPDGASLMPTVADLMSWFLCAAVVWSIWIGGKFVWNNFKPGVSPTEVLASENIPASKITSQRSAPEVGDTQNLFGPSEPKEGSHNLEGVDGKESELSKHKARSQGVTSNINQSFKNMMLSIRAMFAGKGKQNPQSANPTFNGFGNVHRPAPAARHVKRESKKVQHVSPRKIKSNSRASKRNRNSKNQSVTSSRTSDSVGAEYINRF